MRIRSPRTRRLVVMALAVLVHGCGPDRSSIRDEAGVEPADTAPDQDFEARVYERNIVFMTTGQDSAIIVPWFFTARAHPGGVSREVRGWLARSGEWEPFFQDRWEGPPTRAPFRILPRAAMRLLVGKGDALEAILYEEGSRQLDILLNEPVADWSGTRGEVFRVNGGSMLLGGQPADGLLLDVIRAHRPADVPSGGWIFLEGGPSVTIVLEAPVGIPPGSTPYLGWARLGGRELRWPRIKVEWTETRSFERARRDVPVEWSIVSDDGALGGILTTVALLLTAGEGAGPILPVDGLFQVRGTLTIDGDSYDVRGFLRHIQP
ncbi:MAG: hypothetical protein BMS9Abin29_1432 [Gemmatimonadota bacterium]|nr:MAG: hypothetical protein BMS9Abin29_1432 [Gemmatimonadota bacterium]